MIFSHVKYSVHIAIPRTGVEPTWGLNRTYAVFSRLFSEVISLVQPLTANRQHEEEVKRIIRPSLIFSFILSYERTKVKKKITVVNQDCHRSVCIGFVSENLCVKLLPPFLRLPFVFFEVTGAYWTCPASYVQVLSIFDPRHISRLPHIIVNYCRWLGESRPTLKLSIVSWSTILIEQSLIEVKVAVSLIFCLDLLCGPQRDISFCLWFYQ